MVKIRKELCTQSENKIKKRRVIVVDDHPIVREGLEQLISREADLDVCCSAENAAEALQDIEKCSPDIAIIDLNLEESSGITLIENLSYSYPDLPILVLSMYDESVYAERCLKIGAKGYIMKQEPSRKMLEAIRMVLNGEVYVSDSLKEQILDKFVRNVDQPVSSPVEVLSTRELEVYQLIGKGMKKQDIADILHISPKTVDTYIEHIKRKLNFGSLREMLLHSINFYNAAIK
jgi:DNA-binding NarL/FixJ family response regulator